jgi:hypothetical protein
VCPVKYELGFFISEDDILHSYSCEKPRILHVRYEVHLSVSEAVKRTHFLNRN